MWGADEVRVYLYPSVTTSEALSLGDVARLEADEADSLSALPLDPSIYADGFIDAGEVRAFLSGRTAGILRIFGTAVRVRAPGQSPEEGPAATEFAGPAVHNGERVDVLIRRRGIVIQAPGTALADGKLGDRVFIRTDNSRRIRGVIAGRGLVEVEF